jgi:hypothetical protein
MTTGYPRCAKTWAMPFPIVPAPMTAIVFTFMFLPPLQHLD